METPLQVIKKLRKIFPEYEAVKIGYAGRLDPLAHGVLLLMIGEATKERGQYLNLSKEYEFEAVFGMSTDTYDVLGIIRGANYELRTTNCLSSGEFENSIQKFIKNKIGKHAQPYPPFSSKAVSGKPLYMWAKENKLSDIEIPTKEIEIYSFDLLSMGEVFVEDLQDKILKSVKGVDGDFRQKEILEKWEVFLNSHKGDSFKTAKFKIACSSGTYVRNLVNELGRVIGGGAVTLEILRTRVGGFSLEDSLRI